MTYRLGATPLGNLAYAYDALGQRTNITGSLAPNTLPGAITNATNDLANRVTNWNGTNIVYDLNGNILNDGTRTYTWDARNRLTSIAGPVNASFQYDPFGRRIRKTIATTTTGYLYDGPNPVQELNGATPIANLITGLNIDERFRRTDGLGSRDFLTDALGSTLALADSAGTLRTRYTYDPYGNTTQTGQANSNPFQYTGREQDGTGLYFYRARYYSPPFQRFVSSDPIGLRGGLNTYSYVNNNPLRFMDPLGLARKGTWVELKAEAIGPTGGYGAALLDGTNDVVEVSAFITGKWTGTVKCTEDDECADGKQKDLGTVEMPAREAPGLNIGPLPMPLVDYQNNDTWKDTMKKGWENHPSTKAFLQQMRNSYDPTYLCDSLP